MKNKQDSLQKNEVPVFLSEVGKEFMVTKTIQLEHIILEVYK